MEGNGSVLIEVLCPHLLRGSEETHEKSQDSVSDGIRIGNLPNTDLHLYHYASLLCRNVFYSRLHVLDFCQRVVKQSSEQLCGYVSVIVTDIVSYVVLKFTAVLTLAVIPSKPRHSLWVYL